MIIQAFMDDITAAIFMVPVVALKAKKTMTKMDSLKLRIIMAAAKQKIQSAISMTKNRS